MSAIPPNSDQECCSAANDAKCQEPTLHVWPKMTDPQGRPGYQPEWTLARAACLLSLSWLADDTTLHRNRRVAAAYRPHTGRRRGHCRFRQTLCDERAPGAEGEPPCRATFWLTAARGLRDFIVDNWGVPIEAIMSVVGHSLPIHSASAPTNVRYAPNSDLSTAEFVCPLSAITGPLHRSKQHRYSISPSARASSVAGTSTPIRQKPRAIRPGLRICQLAIDQTGRLPPRRNDSSHQQGQ